MPHRGDTVLVVEALPLGDLTIIKEVWRGGVMLRGLRVLRVLRVLRALRVLRVLRVLACECYMLE